MLFEIAVGIFLFYKALTGPQIKSLFLCCCRRFSNGCGGRIRTDNPLLTRQVHFRCATGASGTPQENRTLILGLEDRCSIR